MNMQHEFSGDKCMASFRNNPKFKIIFNVSNIILYIPKGCQEKELKITSNSENNIYWVSVYVAVKDKSSGLVKEKMYSVKTDSDEQSQLFIADLIDQYEFLKDKRANLDNRPWLKYKLEPTI